MVVYGFNRRAVAQDRDPIRHISDLVELMGDDDRGHALLLELQKEVEKHPGVLLVQGGGGLVEDEQFHVLGERLGDLDKLLLAGTDVLDQGVLALLQADLIHVGAGLVEGAVPVDAETAFPLVAQEHVLSDGELRDQRQLLVDDNDPQLFAVFQGAELADLTVIDDVAGIAAEGIGARQHVHQGGFPRAVLAHQGVDLAALDLEVDVVKRLDAGKLLRDVLHHKNVISQNVYPPLCFSAVCGMRGNCAKT